MSHEKINPKKIVEDIFGPSGDASTSVRARPLGSIVGKNRGKRGRQRKKWFAIPLAEGWCNQFGAIDIGTASIKFVLLSRRKGKLSIEHVSVKHFAGVGRKENETPSTQDILNRLGKIAGQVPQRTKVAIAINDPSVLMRSFTVSADTQDEYQETILRELSDEGAINPEAYFVDYISEKVMQGSEAGNIFVIAAPKKLIYERFETVQQAGFKVLGIETNNMAVLEAVEHIAPWESSDCLVMLDVGASQTTLSVVYGNKILLNRLISVAGNRFTKAVQSALKCDFESAERLKIKHGLKAKYAPPKVENSDSSESGDQTSENIAEQHAASQTEEWHVSQALASEVDRLLGEAERSFQFALSQQEGHENLSIKDVVLVGGSAGLPKLKDYVEQRWRARVRSLDLWDAFDVSNKVDAETLSDVTDSIMVALGLALRVKQWKVLPFGWGMPAS